MLLQLEPHSVPFPAYVPHHRFPGGLNCQHASKLPIIIHQYDTRLGVHYLHMASKVYFTMCPSSSSIFRQIMILLRDIYGHTSLSGIRHEAYMGQSQPQCAQRSTVSPVMPSWIAGLEEDNLTSCIAVTSVSSDTYYGNRKVVHHLRLRRRLRLPQWRCVCPVSTCPRFKLQSTAACSRPVIRVCTDPIGPAHASCGSLRLCRSDTLKSDTASPEGGRGRELYLR
jgi:hypothetical protein